MSCESEESTHPVTPVGPFVGSVPRLLAVLVVLPASPVPPPSVWTALHGARPDALVSILGPKASIVLAGKSKTVDSLSSLPCSISLL